MARAKKINNVDLLLDSLLNSLQYAKACYEGQPTNEMYSVIISIELTIKEVQKIK
jgi:hypothetical protein